MELTSYVERHDKTKGMHRQWMEGVVGEWQVQFYTSDLQKYEI